MKFYKKADKTKPRFRISKYRYNLINKELHKKFVEQTGINIPWKEFKDIAGSISDEFVKMVIEERNGVVLPKGVGNIWLGLFRIDPERVEILRAKAGDDVYHHFFKEFDGKIVWDFKNVRYPIKTKRFYSFKPHRTLKTMAHEAFVNFPERYRRTFSGERTLERIKNKKQKKNEITQGSTEHGENTE